MPTGYRAANEQVGMELRDVWTTAYINDLPDSAFLYIAPGGTKTNGKTDGAHRYFPVRGADGKPDAAHINNAIARINQANIPDAAKVAAMKKAKAMSAAHPDIGSGPTGKYEGSAGSGRSRRGPVDVEYRTVAFELELRGDGDGRTLIGRAVPYGPTAPIPGGTERFILGAFSRQIAGGPDALQRVKLFGSHHDRLTGRAGVGKTVSLSEQTDGLHGAWQMYDTGPGNDALHLVSTGEVRGLSVGFKPLSSRRAPDGTMERVSAHLDHVTLTNEPAYADAAIVAVRSARPLAGYRTDLERARGLLDRILAGS